MPHKTETVTVDLEDRSYRIHIASGNLGAIGSRLLELYGPMSCAVITDENVAEPYAQNVIDSLEETGFDVCKVVIPAGEEQKTLQTAERLYGRFLDAGLDRSSIAIAVGGGVVGDITGFVAATYMRGIPYVQVPTTLLAQVDSSVGGKTAVNLPQGKNLVGAFYQPGLVLIDVATLNTVPVRELKSGMVEVIKYGVIRDGDFFERLEHQLDDLLNLEPSMLVAAVRRCCEIKAAVVSEDETEKGQRAILNYGHTAGHAVEKLTDYSEMRHGEAVSAGMVVAAELAQNLHKLDAEAAKRQNRLLERLGTPTRLPSFPADQIMDQIQRDKKTVGGVPRFILARQMGAVEICADIAPARIRQALIRCGATN